MQAERGVAQELVQARADWQASLAEDTRELKVLLPCLLGYAWRSLAMNYMEKSGLLNCKGFETH